MCLLILLNVSSHIKGTCLELAILYFILIFISYSKVLFVKNVTIYENDFYLSLKEFIEKQSLKGKHFKFWHSTLSCLENLLTGSPY